MWVCGVCVCVCGCVCVRACVCGCVCVCAMLSNTCRFLKYGDRKKAAKELRVSSYDHMLLTPSIV